MLWFGGLVFFLLMDALSRERLKTAGPWIAFAIALVMTFPVIVWNAKHNWVSYRHVAHQTGANGGRFSFGNVAEFIASQIGVVGPILAVIVVLATLHAFRSREPRLLFLATIGSFFFALTFITSFFAKVQVNWPAPAYFTLMILATHFLGTRLQTRESWRPWRGWFWGTVILGVIIMPIAHDSSLLFPLVRHTRINPASLDLSTRLRGWQMLGDHLTAQIEKLGHDPIILCDDYMQTAETAFYVKGQPRTYYAGSYFANSKRFTQYDMWPNRRLDDPKLIGRTALYVGKGGGIPDDMRKVFERVEPLPELPVIVRGVKVRTFKTWIGYGFKGMSRPDGKADY
jgi:hypothetical protein